MVFLSIPKNNKLYFAKLFTDKDGFFFNLLFHQVLTEPKV